MASRCSRHRRLLSPVPGACYGAEGRLAGTVGVCLALRVREALLVVLAQAFFVFAMSLLVFVFAEVWVGLLVLALE